jgi:MFS family permease
MKRYQNNSKWLTWFAPFQELSISAAYLMPFFLQNGLSLLQVFALQSIFSLASLLWEIPSGYIADRFGRALCIKISAPLAAGSMIAYGFSHLYWQFIICELGLAIANGLISAIDTALLFDSLKADGNQAQFVKLSQRINAFGFAAVAFGVPIAYVLVKYVSISSTLVADGILICVGCFFVFRLVESPKISGSQEKIRLSAWYAVKKLGSNTEVRWLILLSAVLSTSTYLGFWLSVPYYNSMKIPVVLFSSILAIRSLWKAWLSHRFHQQKHLERNMFGYALLAGLVYLSMATRQLWLIWVVLGHDVIQALYCQPITDKLNTHMPQDCRATMNSVINLIMRLSYSIAGPLVGLLIGNVGLQVGFVVTGMVCSGLAFVALSRLHRLKTFVKGG